MLQSGGALSSADFQSHLLSLNYQSIWKRKQRLATFCPFCLVISLSSKYLLGALMWQVPG